MKRPGITMLIAITCAAIITSKIDVRAKDVVPDEYKNISLTENFEETVKEVKALLAKKYKNAAFLLYALGQQHIIKGDHKSAKNYFLKVISDGVSYGEDLQLFVFISNNNLCYIFMNEEKIPEAMNYADTAIKMIENKEVDVPKDHLKSQPYYNKAELLFKMKNYEESKAYFAKAFGISEEEATVNNWCQYASLLWGEGDKELARSIAILNKAEGYHPNDPNITFNRGRAYFSQKNYNKALEDFLFAALVAEDSYPTIIDESLKYIRAIFSMEDTGNYLKNYSMGISLRHQEKYEEAKNLLSEVVKKNPEALFAYLCLGEIYKGIEKYDDALGMFKKVEKYKPNLAYLQMSYAETYYIMRSMKFRDHAIRCIELVPDSKLAQYAKKMLNVQEK